MNLEEASEGIEEGKLRMLARIEGTREYLKLDDFSKSKLNKVIQTDHSKFISVQREDKPTRASFYVVDAEKQIVYYSSK